MENLNNATKYLGEKKDYLKIIIIIKHKTGNEKLYSFMVVSGSDLR